MPLKRAEDLIRTLPGIVSAKIFAGDNGIIEQIHVLTKTDLTSKQVVRNIESALVAHLSLRVDHRKISVASTTGGGASPTGLAAGGASETKQGRRGRNVSLEESEGGSGGLGLVGPGRRLYFEDVEVKGSRLKGVSCRVTLRKGEASWMGEAQGIEGDRSRLDLAARATVLAIAAAEEMEGQLAVEGVKMIEAFDRSFVFVAVTVRSGRESQLLAGTCEIRESAETASVFAVLDATNRWIEQEPR